MSRWHKSDKLWKVVGIPSLQGQLWKTYMGAYKAAQKATHYKGFDESNPL